MTKHPRGPRRHPSRSVTFSQAHKLSAAFNRARQIGFPLNSLITIHWGLAPSAVEPFDRWTRLCEALGKWLARQGYPPTWAFVRERGRAEQEHMHLALHIPKRRRPTDVKAVFERWVSVGAEFVEPNAVDVAPQRTPSMIGLVRYMLKGGDNIVRQSWGVSRTHERDQGVINGKRLGVSRNLDGKARAEALIEDVEPELAAKAA